MAWRLARTSTILHGPGLFGKTSFSAWEKIA